jgi:hypothetical protein
VEILISIARQKNQSPCLIDFLKTALDLNNINYIHIIYASFLIPPSTIITYECNLYNIQGVSEFYRQTFRADSMIKNKHKTLNTHGIKNA